LDPRKLVAREAARLLYTGASEEYKHAKEQAANSLGMNTMPSNHEVAIELDLLAERTEGDERRRLLINMRGSAMKLMQALAEFLILIKRFLRSSPSVSSANRSSSIATSWLLGVAFTPRLLAACSLACLYSSEAPVYRRRAASLATSFLGSNTHLV